MDKPTIEERRAACVRLELVRDAAERLRWWITNETEPPARVADEIAFIQRTCVQVAELLRPYPLKG